MVKEMKYTVAEEFLKQNPDFRLFVKDNHSDCHYDAITVKDKIDFDNVDSLYIIKANEDVLSIVTNLVTTEAYKIVK